MAKGKYIVLYFTHGNALTEEQQIEAAQYGPYTRTRNKVYHTVGSGLEPCTAVAGDPPPDYAAAFPRAVSYIDFMAGLLPVVEAPLTLADQALGNKHDRPLMATGHAPLPGPTSVTGEIELPPAPPAGKTAPKRAAGAPPPPPGSPPPPDWSPNA